MTSQGRSEAIIDPRGLLKNYGLRDDRIQLEPLPAGTATQKWLVHTPLGLLILRRLVGLSRARVAFVTASQDYIARRCGLAARILSTEDGERFATDPTGAAYILVPYWRGSVVTINDPVVVERLGACLGRLHAVFADAELEGDPTLMTLAKDPGERLTRALRNHGHNSDSPAVAALVYKSSLIHLYQEVYERALQLSTQVVHGDFHPSNIIQTARERSMRVLDFDRSCRFYRAYEVMRGMVGVLELGSSPSAQRAERTRAFLRGYLRECELGGNEREVMLDLYIYVQVGDTYCLEATDVSGPRIAYGQHRFRTLQLLVRERDHLQAVIGLPGKST